MRNKFRDFSQIKVKETLDMPESTVARDIFLASLITGKPVDMIERLTIDEFRNLKQNLLHKSFLTDSEKWNEWTYDFDFSKCTVQQFLDVEIVKAIFQKSEALYRIVSILMYNNEQKIYTSKEIIELSDSKPSESLKIYEYNRLKELNHYAKKEISASDKLEGNYNALMELPISWVWDKVEKFQSSYIEFTEKYSYIFNNEGGSSEDNLSDGEKQVNVHESLYSLLMMSIEDDINKMYDILEMNVNDWLTFCTYKMRQIEKSKAQTAALSNKNKNQD